MKAVPITPFMRPDPPDDATLMRFPTPVGEALDGASQDGASGDGASGDGMPPAVTPHGSVLPGDDAPLTEGERVGPYEVREHIGDGGMASVYRAWHTGLHRFEALKIPRQQGRYGPEAAFVRRLLTEARTVAGLHHPHIALIHAVSEADSPLQYFAMELVDGGDLAEFIQARGKVAPEEALPILKQIAEALDYAHENGVVHRDIKPANVLLTSDGIAKVVDFGISRAGEEAGGTRLTRSGMIVGTPEYMSPEQSGSGDPVTHRTDIYSLGVVAYEMLCGTPPFVAGEGVNRLSILMKHLGEAPASPLRTTPGFGPAATETLLTALAKKPEDRFATCGEFVAALTRAFHKRSHTQIQAAPGSAEDEDGASRPITRSLSERTAEALPVDSEELATKRALSIPRPVTRRRPGALLTAVSSLALCILVLLGWWQRDAFESTALPSTTPRPVLKSTVPVVKQRPPVTPTAKAPLATAPLATANKTTTRIEARHSAIPFKRRTRNDDSLRAGTSRIVQRGQDGLRETRWEIKMNGSNVLAKRALTTRVLRAPRDQITMVGSKAPSPRITTPPPTHPAPQAKTPQAKAPQAKAPQSAKTTPPKPGNTNRAARRQAARARRRVKPTRTPLQRAAPRIRAIRRLASPKRPPRARGRRAPRRSYGREAPLPP